MELGLEIRDKGLHPPIPKNCEPIFASLMRQCWQLNPADRPTFTQIVQQLRESL